MPDICTAFGAAAVSTLVGCMAPQTCTNSDDGKRMFCEPARAIPCAPAMVQWSCKREDGSTYIFEEPFGAPHRATNPE